VTHLLVVLALIAAYAVFVLVFPTGQCRKCGGWGHKAKRPRNRSCKRCKGTGRSFRPGARIVHGGAAAAVRYLRSRREGGR
jgi:hypothetical protein